MTSSNEHTSNVTNAFMTSSILPTSNVTTAFMTSSIPRTSNVDPAFMLSSIEYTSNVTAASNNTSLQIVNGSETEQVISISIILLIGIVGTLGQLVVMVTIWKTLSLHTAHFYMLFAYCAIDSTVLGVSVPFFLLQVITGQTHYMTCKIASILIISLIFTLHYTTGLLSVERYVFFCHPLSYERWFRAKTVVAYMVLIVAVPAICMVLSSMFETCIYHASSLICEMSDQPKFIILFMIFFRIVPAIIAICCMLKILKLIKSIQIVPALPTNAAPLTTPPLVTQARKGIRMIALVTGTFWATYVPASLLRLYVFSQRSDGYTWEAIDSRQYTLPAILIRLSTYMISIVPPMLSPFVYLYTRKDLRNAVTDLFA